MFGSIMLRKRIWKGQLLKQKLSVVFFGIFFSLICVGVSALTNYLLFDTFKITASISDYDRFFAPIVEEPLKFSFIFLFVFAFLKKASIRLADALLFGALFGLGFGTLEKFVPLLTSNVQIYHEAILFKIILSSSLHIITSLIHSYNVFSSLISKRNLIWSVILFAVAILLHVIYNCGWYL